MIRAVSDAERGCWTYHARARQPARSSTSRSTAGYVAMGSYSAIKTWVTRIPRAWRMSCMAPVSRSRRCAQVGCVRNSTSAPTSTSVPSRPRCWLDADRLVADCLDDAVRRQGDLDSLQALQGADDDLRASAPSRHPGDLAQPHIRPPLVPRGALVAFAARAAERPQSSKSMGLLLTPVRQDVLRPGEM